MKKCLRCAHTFSVSGWTCPACGFTPVALEGLTAFSPENAFANEGFEEQFYEHMFDLEASNFWFKARSQLVNSMLRKHFPGATNYLEIGCGSGYMLARVEQEFPDMQLSGSEVLSRGLAYSRKRVQRAHLFQMDARRIPFDEEFDVIGAYDVIEHIAEDEAVLSEMHAALRADGGIVITVPQHKCLWSHVDEYSHHKRRYSASELRKKVEAAGFTVVRTTSFVSLLLPLMYLSRRRDRHPRPDYDSTAELRLNGAANSLLGGIMNLERLAIDTGLSLPVGGSLLLVAKKQALRVG